MKILYNTSILLYPSIVLFSRFISSKSDDLIEVNKLTELIRMLTNGLVIILSAASLISFVIIIFQVKRISGSDYVKKDEIMNIKNNTYDIFESWFLIISPLLIFTDYSIINNILLIVTYIIIIQIIEHNNLIFNNVLYILLGYKYYIVKYDRQNEIQYMSKKDYNDFSNALREKDTKVIHMSDRFYILH